MKDMKTFRAEIIAQLSCLMEKQPGMFLNLKKKIKDTRCLEGLGCPVTIFIFLLFLAIKLMLNLKAEFLLVPVLVYALVLLFDFAHFLIKKR